MFEDETKFNVLVDHCLGSVIYFMQGNNVSFFNLLTKSQVSFKSDKPFPEYINYTVTTKDKRLFIIGEKEVFEFCLAANTLQDRASMNEGSYGRAVAYEST